MKLSVLMAVYGKDRADFFDAAMESVWTNQVRRPDQIVLVVDGHIGGTLAECVDRWRSHLTDSLLSVIWLGDNLGLGAALHAGLMHCSGDLVGRMDSDDVCEPNRFALQIRVFESDPELAVLGTAARLIDAGGRGIGLRRVPLTNAEIHQWIWACPFVHPSVMFRRNAIVGVGGYRPELRTRQDYDLWFRCAAARLTMRNLPDYLLHYRQTDGSEKHRDLRVVWQQVKIGWQGCRKLGAPPKHRLAIAAPLFMYFLPKWIAVRLRKRLKFRQTGAVQFEQNGSGNGC